MEQERGILERLDRIDELRRDDAPAEDLLAEVRLLLDDAEAWVRSEPDVPKRAAAAVERAQAALAEGESRREGVLTAH